MSESSSRPAAGDTNESVVEARARRTDRWAAEAAARSGAPWIAAAASLVVAGYGVAALVVASARGSIGLSDDAQVALVGVVAPLGGIAALCAFAGARRSGPRAIAWGLFALAVVLVAAAAVAVIAVLFAIRELS